MVFWDFGWVPSASVRRFSADKPWQPWLTPVVSSGHRLGCAVLPSMLAEEWRQELCATCLSHHDLSHPTRDHGPSKVEQIDYRSFRSKISLATSLHQNTIRGTDHIINPILGLASWGSLDQRMIYGEGIEQDTRIVPYPRLVIVSFEMSLTLVFPMVQSLAERRGTMTPYPMTTNILDKSVAIQQKADTTVE